MFREPCTFQHQCSPMDEHRTVQHREILSERIGNIKILIDDEQHSEWGLGKELASINLSHMHPSVRNHLNEPREEAWNNFKANASKKGKESGCQSKQRTRLKDMRVLTWGYLIEEVL